MGWLHRCAVSVYQSTRKVYGFLWDFSFAGLIDFRKHISLTLDLKIAHAAISS